MLTTPWNEAIINFNNALVNQELAFMNSSLSLSAKDRKNKLVITGRKFLTSIQELSEIITADRAFLKDLLILATNALQNPSPVNKVNLIVQVDYLSKILINNRSNQFRSAWNVTDNIITVGAGTMVAAYGILAIAGIISLSLSPWAIVAIGTGLILIGGFMAIIGVQEAVKNSRFYRDKQISEMEEFTEVLTAYDFAYARECKHEGVEAERSDCASNIYPNLNAGVSAGF